METGVLIARGMAPLYWHLPEGRTSGSLPDSRVLWDTIWLHRHDLEGFAHTHPGGGQPWPSTEDITTFFAIELALGRKLTWWISNQERTVVVVTTDDYEFDHGDTRVTKSGEVIEGQKSRRQSYRVFPIPDEPSWVAELRHQSNL